MPHVGSSGKWHVSEPGICQTRMLLKLEYIFLSFLFWLPSSAGTFKGYSNFHLFGNISHNDNGVQNHLRILFSNIWAFLSFKKLSKWLKLPWARSKKGEEGGMLSSLTALGKLLYHLLACSVQQGIFTRKQNPGEKVLSLSSFLRQLQVELQEWELLNLIILLGGFGSFV